MKKLTFLYFFIFFLILLPTSCDDSNERYKYEIIQENNNSQYADSEDLKEVSTEESNNNNSSYEPNYNCNFTTDEDVLVYLVGKSFSSQNGNLTIHFSTDGVDVSGIKYLWLENIIIGSYQGIVKLQSIDPSNPNSTLTLYVSCREKSITDGQMALFEN